MAFWVLVLFFFSCSERKEIKEEANLDSKPVKGVIALSPALTEISAEVFPEDLILARTQACDFPEWVKEKPIVQSFPLDLEGLIKYEPDIVFSEPGIIDNQSIEKAKELGLEIKVFDLSHIEGISNAMVWMGDKFPEFEERAQARSELYLNSIQSLKSSNEKNKTVLGIIWSDPIYVFGYNTILSSELEVLGYKNAIDSIFSVPYPEISREYLLKLDPDYIIGMSMAHFDEKLARPYPELKLLKAYKNNRIHGLDHDLFTRPSPRVPRLLEDLKAKLDG